MKSPFYFLVKPIGDRYTNVKKIGDNTLLLNTEISNHEFVNRHAKVISSPSAYETGIKPGEELIIHHNVFRRWYDIKGRERNSSSFIKEDLFTVAFDQVFLHKKENKWKPLKGFCFVQPIKNKIKYDLNQEKPLIGKVVYGNGDIKEGEIVGFSPGDEYEFVINGKRLYRVMDKYITMKYENKRNEETYNPSWA